MQPSADPKIGDIAKEHPEHPAHPHSDVNQLASFKFADEGSADSGHPAHPHFDNAKVPGTVMSDAASDQFVFEKGHDKVADVKPDMIETDHAVADIRHLLHTAHDANAVGALDPNHTTAPQDMTKVPVPAPSRRFSFCLSSRARVLHTGSDTPSAASSWSGTRQVLYSITKHAMRGSADEIGATSISFRPKVFSDPASVVD